MSRFWTTELVQIKKKRAEEWFSASPLLLSNGGSFGGFGSEASYYKCVYFWKRKIMFTIKINPIVFRRLQADFPTPPRCAEKALEKYRVLLEDLLFKAIQRGRDPYDMKLDTYSIPVADLTHKGPQLTAGKLRLHAWLKANQLELVKTVEQGSNLSGLVSKVKLTEWVTIDYELRDLGQQLANAKTASEVDALLCADMLENSNVLTKLFPDYFSLLTAQQKAQVFDFAPIDIASLEAYIVWLNTKATKFPPARVEALTSQAMLILAVAKYANGFFPMRKKPSEFGRMYYAGLSVQNVDKTLRRAMLGNCWEYDIRAAVITWKLTFAEDLAQQLNPNKSYQQQFWASILYVTGRKEFMRDVRAETFGRDSGLAVDFQDSLIKQAITAIGFGARANNNGWREANGEWVNPSLVTIIKNPDERERFLSCPIVQQFIWEQAQLDKYLADGMKEEMPDIYFSPLVTPKLNPSKSRAVAYLYQHSETLAMNVARRVLNKYGISPIANIHDAFIVRYKLSVDVQHEIIGEMQAQMQNPYFSIKGSRLEGFEIAP